MFLEAYRKAKAETDKLKRLVERFRREVTSHSIRTVGGPILRDMSVGMHNVTHDEEIIQIIQSCPPMHEHIRQAAAILGHIRAHGHEDLTKCPLCEEEHKAEGEEEKYRQQGPIERPPLPRPPCEITGEAVATYLRSLRPWIDEARDDLFGDVEPPIKEIPAAPDRYAIADHSQIQQIAGAFCRLDECCGRGAELTAKEGPEWDHLRVGMQRLALIEAVLSVYISVCNPDESNDHGSPFGGLIAKLLMGGGGPGGGFFGPFFGTMGDL